MWLAYGWMGMPMGLIQRCMVALCFADEALEIAIAHDFIDFLLSFVCLYCLAQYEGRRVSVKEDNLVFWVKVAGATYTDEVWVRPKQRSIRQTALFQLIAVVNSLFPLS